MQSLRKTTLSPKTHKLGRILNNDGSPQKERSSSFSSYGKGSPRKKTQEFSSSFDFFDLIKSWEEVVGKMAAQNTLPIQIRDKNLIILCRHPAFAQQMSFMADALIKNIAQRFPSLKNKILKIQFQHKSEIDFLEKTKHIQNEKSIEENQKQKYHPYSPEYREAKIQADLFLKDFEGMEDKAKQLLSSLYIQLLLK